MNARIDLAVDRDPELMVSTFVEPLLLRLQQRESGSVERHTVDGLLCVYVDLALSEPDGMDHVMEFLAEANAPVGSVVYWLDERGQKQDIFVLGPPDAE
jgi:hypothetical protein